MNSLPAIDAQFDSSPNKTSPTDHSDIRSFIFNANNLTHYGVGALQALSSVNKAMANAQRPFSGIAHTTLAEKFKAINCGEPVASFTDALQEVEELYLDHAVYFHHPHYMAHLNCPVVYPAVIAEQILSAVNTSVDTWDQSGGATLIEQKLVDWTCSKIGYDKAADGIFTSGGTQSNLMAMLIARDHAVNRFKSAHSVKYQGLPDIARKFRIFTSELSHFSIQKSAALLGLGYESVISVQADKQFEMNSDALIAEIETCKAMGLIPIAVVATAGTTDFGSIDPINSIADIAAAENLWFHVDAAYGGGLLISPHDDTSLKGIHRADSVTVDYHKSFMQPVSCSAFLLKDRSQFAHITHHAEYLNPLSDVNAGIPNLVDKSLQTTRRFDALKLWLTLRTIGEKNLGQGFESARSLARQSYMLMQEDSAIEVLTAPKLTALVFRFNLADSPLSDDMLNHINAEIRNTLVADGSLMVARTKVNHNVYLKFTLLNPATSIDDVKWVLANIKSLGYQIAQQYIESNPSTNEQNSDTQGQS